VCCSRGSAALFRMDYGAGARRMTIDALGDPWTPEDACGWVAEALGDAGWVHVAPLTRADFRPETLAELARGRQLSLDGQGLVRPARLGPLELDADYDPELLRHVSILKLAEEEAELLVDLADRQSLARLGVSEVVVTLGERGSLVLADGAVQHVPAEPVDADPTGAGDAFAAVYLEARSRNLVPLQAAREATAVVSTLLAA
jgi:sugar/nucleoside kinase (ribokinase family)